MNVLELFRLLTNLTTGRYININSFVVLSLVADYSPVLLGQFFLMETFLVVHMVLMDKTPVSDRHDDKMKL